MQEFPHHYVVTAEAGAEGEVALETPSVERLVTGPPAEFGGPGDRWSPETLFVGAIADCYVLSFRAVARASRLEWTRLSCRAEGILDRVDRVTRFTGYRLEVHLVVPPGSDEARAHRVLEKAEQACLISSSLATAPTLEASVTTS